MHKKQLKCIYIKNFSLGLYFSFIQEKILSDSLPISRRKTTCNSYFKKIILTFFIKIISYSFFFLRKCSIIIYVCNASTLKSSYFVHRLCYSFVSSDRGIYTRFYPHTDKKNKG